MARWRELASWTFLGIGAVVAAACVVPPVRPPDSTTSTSTTSAAPTTTTPADLLTIDTACAATADPNQFTITVTLTNTTTSALGNAFAEFGATTPHSLWSIVPTPTPVGGTRSLTFTSSRLTSVVVWFELTDAPPSTTNTSAMYPFLTTYWSRTAPVTCP